MNVTIKELWTGEFVLQLDGKDISKPYKDRQQAEEAKLIIDAAVGDVTLGGYGT